MDQFWELMDHGYGAMWAVLALSVAALAVAIERLIVQWDFTARARALAESVNRCLSRGALDEARSACERSPSPMADIYLVGYERFGRSKPEHVATAVHRERQRVAGDLRARLWMLGTIGATAPFVGLFGTVMGIKEAMSGFKGTDVNFSVVSGPISGALIVTAFGIFVAVATVIIFNFFSQRTTRMATEMKLLTDEFLELLLELPGDAAPTKGKKTSDKPDKGDKDEKGKDGDRQAA
jgi:biopolymer transport protein ExbB